MFNIITISFVISVVIFIFVIESVRRGIIETKYSILWIGTSVTMGIFSSTDFFLEKISEWMHVEYAPAVIFLFGLLFAFGAVFDLTRRISKVNHQLVSLTQEYTILKEKLEKEGK
jgi:hypothetical protein